ncbi:uncharacterized protein LOC113147655 [Anabas testudineus]|uniref:uncharacterized protein LOC113147655 n=1 Tax=Anabas testudineus TaxID=64144 RepID=UPI000E46147D|nr:uncharacterized protein LOC113147655 [Anabas testudineus]
MDLKDSLVKGGVLIVHQIHEGKHQYEVNNVVKYKNTNGEKMFVRGDKLMRINDMDLQDLTPEELAKMIAMGNLKLMVHKASRMEEHNNQFLPAVETLHPISKEFTILQFSMEMKREADLEENEVRQEEDRRDDGGVEEDICRAEDREERDLLVISMNTTSISVVKGRGCGTGAPCHGCNGTGCTFNDVVMVSTSSTVTLVPRGSFRQDKPLTASIEHVASQNYIRALCSQHILYASPNPERITIYHYKSNFMDRVFRGIPVVLNFTDSNCFIRCCREGGRAFLKVETCEKQRLKQITKTDERALSFVFYMKSDRSKTTRFESALYSGWFIQIVSVNTEFQVKIDTVDQQSDPSFLFVIQK